MAVPLLKPFRCPAQDRDSKTIHNLCIKIKQKECEENSLIVLFGICRCSGCK